MSRNVKKVPIILQMEALECGAASLAMILAYYKKFIPLEKLRTDCNISRDGSSAKYIIRAAKYHKLNAVGSKMEVERLKKEKDFPMIIHWNFNHFVVLCGFKNNKAVINDPAEGRVMISMEEFDKSFTGIVLKFSPSEDFKPYGKPKSMFKLIKDKLKGNNQGIVFISLMGLVVFFTEFVKPIFYKMFTDKILIYSMGEWIQPLMIGMFTALAVGFIAQSLKNIYLAKLQAKISIYSSSTFMWHILRLPVEFFSQRFAGDISSRQQSNNAIAYYLCNSAIPVALNVVMAVIYLVIMFYFNEVLALIGVAMAIVNILVIKYISTKNLNYAMSAQRDKGKLLGAGLSVIAMIETIKASGAETSFFEKLSGYQTKYNNSLLEMNKHNTVAGIFPQIISGVSSGIILMLGVYYILKGNLTIGSLMAFQCFMDMFLMPIGSIITSIKGFQEMGGYMERVEDVMNYPTDVEPTVNNADNTEYKMLSGNIEIDELCFAYSPLAPNIIENFSLKAEKGQTIALVGGSGSGKSTIAKVVSGLYRPRSGKVLFDGKTIDEIDRYIFTSSVAVVDQSISIFSGTVRDNITMWDKSISDETLVSACKDACIHEDIMKLTKGYDHDVIEEGKNFSGGQVQRLEIARAFVLNPSILILDEATSALDPITEKSVMDAVKRRNITCLVIAHRLSTIRDADEIIVLDKGIEVERGTHSFLIEKNGKYASLVKSG